MASSGCLTALAAKGVQDVHLTCNADCTLWMASHARCTSFQKCESEVQFTSAAGYGRNMTATIPRAGDLLSKIYLHLQLGPVTYQVGAPYDPDNGDLSYYTNSVGHAFIDEAAVSIGSQDFDLQTGVYMDIWEHLSAPAEKLMTEMIGFGESTRTLGDLGLQTQFLYVPLQFWFNRFYEQALPLIALQYHEVKIRIRSRALAALIVREGATAPAGANQSAFPAEVVNIFLLCNFIFLDTIERRLFAQTAHQYLIDQVQNDGGTAVTAASTQIQPRQLWNHPVKELIWIIQQDTVVAANDYFNYAGPADANGLLTEAFGTAQFFLNAHPRTNINPALYYRQVQPHEVHSRLPIKYIYVYSFSLHPEKREPDSTVNMSRIDNVSWRILLGTGATPALPATVASTARFYARSYNVIKLVSGMAGQLYAN